MRNTLLLNNSFPRVARGVGGNELMYCQYPQVACLRSELNPITYMYICNFTVKGYSYFVHIGVADITLLENPSGNYADGRQEYQIAIGYNTFCGKFQCYTISIVQIVQALNCNIDVEFKFLNTSALILYLVYKNWLNKTKVVTQYVYCNGIDTTYPWV